MVIGFGGGEFVLVGYCVINVIYTFNLVNLFFTEETHWLFTINITYSSTGPVGQKLPSNTNPIK